MPNTLQSLKHLKRYQVEAFWSKAYAEQVAARIEKHHPYLVCAVDYTLYCDGSRDWTVHTFEREGQQ